MGRTFETLRRRDAGHPPLGDLVRQAPPRTVPAPMLDSDFDFGDADVPFIEVGGVRTDAPTTVLMQPTLAEQRQESADPTPSAVRFVPRPTPSPVVLGVSRDVALVKQPGGPEAEQYRQIGDALRTALAQASLRTLLLAPGADVVGASATLNLALAFAESGECPVLVIDADSHNAAIAAALELALAPGWAELLVGLPLAQALQDTSFARLHVIAAGNRLVEGTAVLHGERVREILDECRRRYEVVLVQSPSWSDAAELGTLARACDAICMVHSKASAESLNHAAGLRALQRQGLRVLGSIVTSG